MGVSGVKNILGIFEKIELDPNPLKALQTPFTAFTALPDAPIALIPS
jgi:hypothetical protein